MLTNEAGHNDDSIDLREIGISEEQAAELRVKFDTFEDWNDPAMDIYNDYDAGKAAVESNRRKGARNEYDPNHLSRRQY